MDESVNLLCFVDTSTLTHPCHQSPGFILGFTLGTICSTRFNIV
jgi:hypothetical protein